MISSSEWLRKRNLTFTPLFESRFKRHRFGVNLTQNWLTQKMLSIVSIRKVQPNSTPLRCRCLELPLYPQLNVLTIASLFKRGKWLMATLPALLITWKSFFASLQKHDPTFGYYLAKCHIITTEHLLEKAQQILLTTKWKQETVIESLVV